MARATLGGPGFAERNRRIVEEAAFRRFKRKLAKKRAKAKRKRVRNLAPSPAR